MISVLVSGADSVSPQEEFCVSCRISQKSLHSKNRSEDIFMSTCVMPYFTWQDFTDRKLLYFAKATLISRSILCCSTPMSAISRMLLALIVVQMALMDTIHEIFKIFLTVHMRHMLVEIVLSENIYYQYKFIVSMVSLPSMCKSMCVNYKCSSPLNCKWSDFSYM